MKKKTNGKLVSGADIVEKRFNGTRYVCIRFSIKDNFSADEYKVEMEAQIKARKDLIVTHYPSLGGGTSSRCSSSRALRRAART